MAALAEENVSLSSSTPYKSKIKTSIEEEIVISVGKQDESELEEGELRDSRLTNASFREHTFKSESWIEILEEEEECKDMQRPPSFKISGFDTDDSQSQASSKREIAIEIFDASNEAKFDRLLREDKLKSPFRRHPSNDFDEAARAELMKHDPSILEFKVGMSSAFQGPSTVVRTVSAESDTACDGFEFAKAKKGTTGETNSPGKRKRGFNQVQKDDVDDTKKPRFNKFRSESTSTTSSEQSDNRRRPEYETDPGVLERRQKQIDYGKNTLGYDNYIQEVPKTERKQDDPKTPPKHHKYSRRAWDGLVKQWRKQLHKYDPNATEEGMNEEEKDEKKVFQY